MKRFNRLLLAVTLLFSVFAASTAQAQLCPGSVLSDDFSNPGLWPNLGNFHPTNPGNIVVTGTETRWTNFRGSQTYRLVRGLNNEIANDFFWRMEFDFTLNTTQILSGAMLMALTSNNLHPRTILPGNPTETNNNTIEVLVANPLNSVTVGNDSVLLSSKFFTNRGAASTRIGIRRNQRYYVRVERVHEGQVVLSIFDDAARFNHVNGSPICYTIDPRIQDFNFIQQGVWTTSSQSRYMTGETDNLCLFDNLISRGCEEGCSITPKLEVTGWGCTYTFTNNSTHGTGTTLFGQSIIDFGDGTWGLVPPGGSITHTFQHGTNNYVCLQVRGHDAFFNCCEETACVSVEALCDGTGEGRGKQANPDQLGDVQTYPNPSTGFVNLKSDRGIGTVSIYDASGKMVKSVEGNGNNLELDLSDLGRGMYFLDVEVEGVGSVKRKVSLL